MNVKPYLAFSGNCQQAIGFYANCFQADIIKRITYENSKIDILDSYQKKLQHAEIKGNGVHILAYDASPDTPLNTGNKMHMSIDFNDPDKAKDIFKKLSEGGQVNNPFNKEEWGALYGRCTDKFGVHWMLNCDL